MKVFAAPIITPESPQIGLRDALRNFGSDYREFNWFPYYRDNRVRLMRKEFTKALLDYQPDFVFTQIQSDAILTRAELAAMTGYRVNWCGDLREDLSVHYSQSAPYYDCLYFSNGRDVQSLVAAGIKAEYLQTGYSPSVFAYIPPQTPQPPEIVFLGNNYKQRFPLSQERQELVKSLQARYSNQFQVYGNGWGDSTVWLDEAQEAQRYRTCKIAINHNHFNDVPRFTSDRLIRAMACGAFVLSNDYPGIEQEFIPGKHLDTYRTLGELNQKIDYYLSHEEEREVIATCGMREVQAKHTWEHRMKQIKERMANQQQGVNG